MQVDGDYVEVVAAAADVEGGAGEVARDGEGDHRQARRRRHLRRRAVREGRRGVVLGSQPAAARHRAGHAGLATSERVRAACARDPGAAGRHIFARRRARAR